MEDWKKQNLAEAAKDIQELLKQLDETYLSDTTAGKMKIATEVITQIDNNSIKRQRVLSAIKSGGVPAFEELLNHPASSFLIAALEDWKKQNLAEAAKDIQELLKQLDETYLSDTTAGKMKIATEVITQIDNNPTKEQRILSAIKAGGVPAFEELLNHPAASFVIAALKDWQNDKE